MSLSTIRLKGRQLCQQLLKDWLARDIRYEFSLATQITLKGRSFLATGKSGVAKNNMVTWKFSGFRCGPIIPLFLYGGF
ncbi:hypothetical protein AYJ05_03385 [Corynebacterium stationis]|uniref:Uncharacterized protein n=1 Tax=Corynebacterium stationis TaxID=1705 RepID=A0A177ICZ3_9CORY|nr:hypothetical protein AYJ05_03385 [Corynebacterium stationis]